MVQFELLNRTASHWLGEVSKDLGVTEVRRRLGVGRRRRKWRENTTPECDFNYHLYSYCCYYYYYHHHYYYYYYYHHHHHHHHRRSWSHHGKLP